VAKLTYSHNNFGEFRAYLASKLEVHPSQVKLTFEDLLITDEDIPAEFDMVNGSTIDVLLQEPSWPKKKTK